MNHDRAIELRRDVGFIGRAEVAAPFELVFERAFGVAFLQHLHGFVVGDAREWRIDLFELGDVAADGLQVGAPLFEAALHDEA